MKNRLQFNRHFALYETREEAINALNNRITDPGFIPLIGEPIVLRYKDADGNVQAILAIGKKAGKSMSDRDYHIVDTADLDEKIAAEVAAREALDAETIKKVIFDGVESEFADNIATLSVSANSIPIGPFEEYVGPATEPHKIHDYYTVLDAVKQVDVNFDDLADKTNKKVDGLHLVKITSGLDTNVREAYELVNLSGLPQENSEKILIYKDSSLYRVYLGHVDDRLEAIDNPTVVSGSGDAAICFIYLRTDGFYDLVAVNVEAFLEETEFKDGLTVDNHEVKVKIAQTSEPFLTVDENGVKLSGVQEAIDTAKSEEEARAEGVEEAIQNELDATQTGAGLDTDGSYIHDHPTSYIGNATSLASADHILDVALKAESDRAFAAEATLQDNIDTEESRATLAEQSISGIVDTFSAATVAEIARVDGRIDSSNASLSELSASTKAFSANTVSEVERLDTKIEDEEVRAIAAENSISADVTALSSATKSFSAATVAEIARVDATAARNKVKSTGNTILVTEPAEGTNIEANIDNKTILSNNGVLGTGLKVVPVNGELESNVREAFVLVDNLGNRINDTVIKIYKSSSLVSVELVNVGGIDYVRITYIDNEGVTKTMDLNIQQLIFEAEFKDGLVVNGSGEVRVEIDPDSESFLTVSQFGVKLSGVQNAINAAVATEATRAKAAEDYVSGQVFTLSSATEDFNRFISGITRNIISGAGLSFGSEEGMYPENHHSGATVIGPAKSLDQADILLDLAVAGLSGELLTLSSTTESFSGAVKDKIDGLSAYTVESIETLSAITSEITASTAAYTFKGDEAGFITTETETIIDPETGKRTQKTTIKPTMPSSNWDDITGNTVAQGNGFATAYDVKQYVKDGIDGDAIWAGDMTLPIPSPSEENPLVGRINFDKDSPYYDTAHEALFRTDNNFVRIAEELGTDSEGYGAHFYPSAKTEDCLLISEDRTFIDAIKTLDKAIDDMDWTGETTSDEVFISITETNGHVSASTANVTTRTLAGYGSTADTKVAASQTLGTALGNLQGQIDSMDYTANTGVDKVITGITQNDGKVVVTSENITNRVITGYAVGADAKVAATDSLGGALGKLQGQINAMDKATQAEANSVIYDVTESDGKVSATSKHIVDIKLSGYTVGADSSTKVTSGDTLGGALGKLQGQINGLDYTANAGTDKVITAITQTDGKVEVATQNITSRIITGYAVGSDAKIAATDSLGGALGKLQGQINAMDKATQAEANSVIYDVTESDGKVSATSKHIVDIKLSGYTVGADNSGKITSGDTLGQALGKLQGQVNGLDYTANAGTDKVITAITQTDGKVEVATQNITSRIVTGYAVGADAKVAATDSLGGALGKLQGQINAMDKSIDALSASVVTNKNNISSLSAGTIQLSADTKSAIATLSAGTIQLSADTKNAINTLSGNTHGVINALSASVVTNKNNISSLSAGTIQLSADTKSAIATLSAGTIQLSANTKSAIATLSAGTIQLSADTKGVINTLSASVVTNKNNISSLSASTIQLSADTKGVIGALSASVVTNKNNVSSLSAGTIQLSADTSAALAEAVAAAVLDSVSVAADGNSTKVTVKVGGVTKSGSAVVPYATNADMVDGLHFVTGKTGTAANTIYFL